MQSLSKNFSVFCRVRGIVACADFEVVGRLPNRRSGCRLLKVVAMENPAEGKCFAEDSPIVSTHHPLARRCAPGGIFALQCPVHIADPAAISFARLTTLIFTWGIWWWERRVGGDIRCFCGTCSISAFLLCSPLLGGHRTNSGRIGDCQFWPLMCVHGLVLLIYLDCCWDLGRQQVLVWYL